MDYQQADRMLQGRCRESRKLGNNTYLVRRDGGIAVRLHATDVVTFKLNGDVLLNSGGWRTPTTKDRINQYAPVIIAQERGVWFVGGNNVFADNMVIHPDGTMSGCCEEDPKADRVLKRKVKDYAQLYADALPLDMPGPGDCFYCYHVTETGQMLGDNIKNKDHLLLHIEEGYVVPSLAYHALKERHDAPAAFWSVFKGNGWSDRGFGEQVIKKAVYKYILSRLGYAV